VKPDRPEQYQHESAQVKGSQGLLRPRVERDKSLNVSAPEGPLLELCNRGSLKRSTALPGWPMADRLLLGVAKDDATLAAGLAQAGS
jgi:hypothetical protein